ncbi:DUF29 family protein [Synechococcales cyanobacterium C]|uniref:DUF29 family protein n=1 Tax=Petrachloros mirabilis ULC683 TaxID=2781853 RepID=A0A8K2A881_9CYAN|nr:DUF29 family protein [Petrachloros mirabilis]NCJ07716.1 DUF29 family protein [Petrachloros mirabilis ULC683]
MEELVTLRNYIEAEQYDQALALVAELEEMSKEDKLNKIYSYGIILLIHLIKQQAEGRSLRSWEVSIYSAATEIRRVNRRRKSEEHYANPEELAEIFTEAFETAIRKAALEAFEGQYSDQALREMVDADQVIAQALEWVAAKD